MILLPESGALVLQLLHHPVKDAYDVVGFLLAYRCQTAAEILCLEQVHPSGYGVQWLDDLPVEIHQVDEAEGDDTLYQVKPPSVFLSGDEEQNSPHHHQQECQDKEKGFQFHGCLFKG